MKQKKYVTKKNRWLAGILVMAILLTVIPAQPTSAASKALTMKDFYYYSGNDLMSFTDVDGPDGRVSSLNWEREKTYRGIKVGDKLSAVTSKYGNAAKKKFDTKESFNKYIRQYFYQYGINISKWKNYVEYTYKKNTKNDRRLRFYLDKNNKVVTVIYIHKYKNYRLTNKQVKDIGITFEAPKGKKITTKTIGGNLVQILPAGTKFTFDDSKVPEFGLLGNVMMYDTQNRVCGLSTMPLNFTWGYVNGIEVEKLLEEVVYFRKCNPSNWQYLKTDLKKLGKYNYFEFTVYDNDAKGGYDIPAKIYFRLG